MQGDPDGHMLVGEASGVNKARGSVSLCCHSGRLAEAHYPASALRSGAVRSRVAA